MKENIIIGLGILVFILIIACVFYFIIKSSKKPINETEKVTKTKNEPKNDLEDLIKAAKEAKDTSTLSKVVLAFIQTQSLGERGAGKLSEDAKKKLSFISTVCANKNADAKMISYLNLELGKKNPSFKREIDLYENMGLAKRRMR